MIAILLLGSLSVWAQSISSSDTLTPHKMKATFYSDRFVGRKTSSGEVFSQNLYTAAHKSLKLGTLLLVTNPSNGKQVIVKVNDRCPKAGVLDMTRKAAKNIGITSHVVTVQVLPQRYSSFWERQDELTSLMENGDFLAFVGTLPVTRSVTNSAYNSTLLAPPPPLAQSDANDDNRRAKMPDRTTPPQEKSQPEKKSDAASRKPNTQSPNGGNADPQSAPTQSSSSTNTTQLYDLILCEANTRGDAQKVISKLPIQYHDIAEIEMKPGTTKVRVRLPLSMREKRATLVLQSLQSICPQSTLIEAK